MTEWLGHRAYDLLQTINNEWEFIDFRPRGTVGIVENEEQYEYMDKIFGSNGRMANELTTILTDKDEMKKLEPFVSPDVKALVWHKKGATVDAFLACNALARRAQANGTEIILGHSVDSISRNPSVSQSDTGINNNPKKYSIHCKDKNG